jgi:Mg-chelatase subunit ChlD
VADFSLEKESVPSAGLWSNDTSTGGTASFFGVTSPALDVVYVIDFSMSLKGSFDGIRREMVRSIGRLDASQKFHIILFSDGRPVEAKSGKLVPATRAAKSEAAEFLAGVQPAGRTEPIAALARAFDVLRAGDRRAKLMCLLTDGVFPDSAEVIRTVKTKNAGGVCVNTYLFGGSASSSETLRQIADQNGGTFVRVGR